MPAAQHDAARNAADEYVTSSVLGGPSQISPPFPDASVHRNRPVFRTVIVADRWGVPEASAIMLTRGVWELTSDIFWPLMLIALAQGLGFWSLARRDEKRAVAVFRDRLRPRVMVMGALVAAAVIAYAAIANDTDYGTAAIVTAIVVGGLIVVLVPLVLGGLGVGLATGATRLDDEVDRRRRNRL